MSIADSATKGGAGTQSAASQGADADLSLAGASAASVARAGTGPRWVHAGMLATAFGSVAWLELPGRLGWAAVDAVQLRAALEASAPPALVLGAIGVAFVATTLGAVAGHPTGLLLATLFGIPCEFPWRPLRSDAAILRRSAAWLSRFLQERPRGYNTPGAHAAYGVIAVKKTIKKLALRAEAGQSEIARAERERARLFAQCTALARRTAAALAKGRPEAEAYSRSEQALCQALEDIDRRLFETRLRLQEPRVRGFLDAWEAEYRGGRVSHALYREIVAEFEQPAGEPPGLLPRGLVRGPLAFFFEYGMFAGRVSMAVLFVLTLRTPNWPYALLLLVLNLYVVEPVVQKLQLALLNLVLDVPGHKALDLARYLREHVPAGGVFRVPITVPKFSSNPARDNLTAILERAAQRAGVNIRQTVPFALRSGLRDTCIRLATGPELEARLLRMADALRSEFERGRGEFPLATEVRVEAEQVVVSLRDSDAAIWEFVGEDASQAFVYLERNLNALRDSVRHLGPKFQPVFIFASNTRDPDVIEYELRRVQQLQQRSDAEYEGRVGFLYLLHGGAWYSYNAYLRRFEAADKELGAALPAFRGQLRADAPRTRSYLLARVLETLEPRQWASALNGVLDDCQFFREFEHVDFESMPAHLRPDPDTLRLLAQARTGQALSHSEALVLNRELLFTALPMRIEGGFFKKVGNDIPVQELLVAGRSRPTVYTSRGRSEHVQDPTVPNYARLFGDFARYTGLRGSNAEIQRAILAGDDLIVDDVPEVGAVLDDKNDFGPGELEKGVALMLHPENRHIVIGVPRIRITFPQVRGRPVWSEHIIESQGARDSHNSSDAQSRVRVFDFSSPAYGKWLKRPKPYLAHYRREVLNAAHALSHDFQQSYFVAGASGRLAGFTEALYGGNHLQVQLARAPSRAAGRILRLGLATLALGGLISLAASAS